MPVLSNARHERFAQELAKGKSACEAYVTAGFKANDGNAIRLKGNEKVQDRIAELQERGAEKAAVTIESITADLLRIAKKAEALAEPAGLSVARAARMDAAKLNGLVIDRSENTNRNYVARLPQPAKDGDEWRSQHMPSQKSHGNLSLVPKAH